MCLSWLMSLKYTRIYLFIRPSGSLRLFDHSFPTLCFFWLFGWRCFWCSFIATNYLTISIFHFWWVCIWAAGCVRLVSIFLCMKFPCSENLRTPYVPCIGYCKIGVWMHWSSLYVVPSVCLISSQTCVLDARIDVGWMVCPAGELRI